MTTLGLGTGPAIDVCTVCKDTIRLNGRQEWWHVAGEQDHTAVTPSQTENDTS